MPAPTSRPTQTLLQILQHRLIEELPKSRSTDAKTAIMQKQEEGNSKT